MNDLQKVFQMIFLSLVFVNLVNQINAQCFKDLINEPARHFNISLYNGGFPRTIQHDSNLYCQWLKDMVNWACLKRIDTVYLDISDPVSTLPAQTVDVVASCFLAIMPLWMKAGAVMEMNPKYPWSYKPSLDTMTQAFTFIKDINNKASNLGSSVTFTHFIGDGENNGIYASNFCEWYGNATIISKIPSDLVVVGEAKQIGLNAIDLFKDAEKKCPGKMTINNVIAFPELYWYMNELKEQGCIGCPHDLDLNPTNVKQCTYNNMGNMCSINLACTPYLQWWNSSNYEDYGKCMNSGCPTQCCKCIGCIPCKYDSQGNAPNKNIIYQSYHNQPKKIASEIKNRLVSMGTLPDLLKQNTHSMFSIETAHNWTFSGMNAYNAAGPNGDNNPNTCMARKYSAANVGNDVICGTFSGFGTWSWDNFLTMMEEYSNQTGIVNIAIYEWQFVPESWL